MHVWSDILRTRKYNNLTISRLDKDMLVNPSSQVTDRVSAVGGMEADIQGTLISVVLAVVAFKSRQAETSVCVHPILTRSPILTGIGLAVVNVLLTVVSWSQLMEVVVVSGSCFR